MKKSKEFQPTIMQSNNVYSRPIAEEDTELVSSESPGHIVGYNYKKRKLFDFRNAVDFVCEEGTPVKAAFDGEVVASLDDITENYSGIEIPSEDIFPRGKTGGNYVKIKHPNGEFSAYNHLRHKGVKATEGQQVKAGDVIGYSGNTGWSTQPHLHFMVYICNRLGHTIKYKQSLKIRWK